MPRELRLHEDVARVTRTKHLIIHPQTWVRMPRPDAPVQAVQQRED